MLVGTEYPTGLPTEDPMGTPSGSAGATGDLAIVPTSTDSPSGPAACSVGITTGNAGANSPSGPAASSAGIPTGNAGATCKAEAHSAEDTDMCFRDAALARLYTAWQQEGWWLAFVNMMRGQMRYSSNDRCDRVSFIAALPPQAARI